MPAVLRMKLYLENGYFDAESIIELPYPFVFVLGGRGTGKTYGALDTGVRKYKGRFHLMRRTQTELDNISNDINSPFKKLNIDKGYTVSVKPQKNYAVAYDNDGEVCEMIALSTVANIRGFDASNVELCIYDEFIPEAHKSYIKNEHLAFLNYYESVNRNRELEGKPALKMRAFSNANDILNPLLIGLQLITPITKMREKKREVYINAERGYCIIDLSQSPISQQKQKTALYKFAGTDSEFSAMALDNDFNSPLSTPVSRPLKEYILRLSVGEIGVYTHKSKNTVYVSHTISGTAPRYELTDTELKRLRIDADWLKTKYFLKRVEFETATAEILLIKYLKIL